MLDLLLSITSRYALPILGGVCIILVAICIYLHSSNRSLAEELGKSQADLTTLVNVCQEERDKAKSVIESQNSTIEKYQIDMIKYNKTVSEKEKQLIEDRVLQQQEIDKELSIDNSLENQLKIVDKILKEFSRESN